MFAVAMAVALLSGTPSGKTQLRLEVKPEAAVVYVNGKKKGTGSKVALVNVKPGNHIIKVVNGGDSHEELVQVKQGEVKTFQWAFEDDRADRKRAAEEEEASAEGP